MKQVITFVALIFFSLSSSAQSGTELEFSRTINEPLDYFDEVTVQVPSGKVWKLVGFAGERVSFNVGNGNSIKLQNEANGESHSTSQLPIFFNELDEITFIYSGNGNSRGYVSLIEYTVIP
jgi:hypothetical protein